MRSTARHPLLVALPLVLALAALPAAQGCAAGAAHSDDQPARLRASGSGAAIPLMRLLAAEQPADGSAAIVFLPGMHSGGALKGVLEGTLELGAISRPPTRDESNPKLNVTWLSSDAIVLAADPALEKLGVRGLTTQQVRDIYAGRVTDWSQLGASEKLPIVVLDRQEDESAKKIMRRDVLGADLKITREALELYYEPDMVSALQSTSGAIGYMSLGYAVSQDIDVTRLTLDGVAPTVKNVSTGKYKVVRPIGLVTRDDAPVAVKSFLAWTVGKEARDLMTSKGYAPHIESE